MQFKKLIALSMSALLSLTSVHLSSFGKPLYEADAADISAVYFNSFDTSVNDGEPIRGVDVSSIIAIEKAGVKFYDDNGQEQDIFKTLADHGVNYIRVRVWNEPCDANGNTYGGGNNDVYTAGLIGKRASQYGMKLLVDIQYSDFWADPLKQTRPKYWQSHDHDTLKGEIYKWTTWVLQSISDSGGDIGMVQVGNETNCFFCGEKDMYKICDLFSSGNKAVRDFDRDILIAHHFANPSNYDNYLWYAKVMNECGLDYDIFATSYYPYWHGTTENLTSVLKKIGDTYGKYVMVAETAYPYTNSDGDNFGNNVTAGSSDCVFRYDISVDGQAQCLRDVFQAVADTGKWGIGAFYWEPAWLGVPDISWAEQKKLWDEYGSGWTTAYASGYDEQVSASGGSSFDNQALFDFHGKPLASLDVFLDIYPRTEKILPKKGSDIPEGEYRIRNVGSGLYLTVSGGEGKAGGNVVQYTADGAADYNTWKLSKDADGYYKIFSGINGGEFLLDLDSGNSNDRTNIGIYTNTSSDAQSFKFIDRGNGSYLIVTKNSTDRSALEIANAAGNDGANAQQFTINGNDCQAWILEPVEEFVLTGDLNDDGAVDIFDLLLMRQQAVSGTYSSSADINDDGSCGVADLVSLQKYILREEGIKKPQKGTPRNTIFPKI